MTPCRSRKKLRNSLRAAQTQMNPTHARMNKPIHVKGELSKSKIQYISDKLEATCSVANHATVVHPDASTEVRQISVETPIEAKVEIEYKIDEGGDRLPDHKLPGDKREERSPDGNPIRILLKKIERTRVTNSPPVLQNAFRHFDLTKLPKFEFPCASTHAISDLSNASVSSTDTIFERNTTTSLKIDFTPNALDENNSKKCLNFWSNLKTRDDLKHIRVHPKEDPKMIDGELMTDDQKIAMKKAYHEVCKKHKEEQSYPAGDITQKNNKSVFI